MTARRPPPSSKSTGSTSIGSDILTPPSPTRSRRSSCTSSKGPVLEREGRSCGAVSGCLGVRRARYRLTGTAGHAGATPMGDRQDPVPRRGRARRGLRGPPPRRPAGSPPWAWSRPSPRSPPRWPRAAPSPSTCATPTTGPCWRSRPTSGRWRSARPLVEAARCTSSPCGSIDPVGFDETLVAAAANACDGPTLVSGPLHDTAALARHGVPSAMIFVASIDGVSHARAEDTAEPDLLAGVRLPARDHARGAGRDQRSLLDRCPHGSLGRASRDLVRGQLASRRTASVAPSAPIRK